MYIKNLHIVWTCPVFGDIFNGIFCHKQGKARLLLNCISSATLPTKRMDRFTAASMFLHWFSILTDQSLEEDSLLQYHQVQRHSIFVFVQLIQVVILKRNLFNFTEEVQLEQITAGLEPQHVVISSNDITPSASLAITPSKQGSRLEVIIEDGIINSNQGANRSSLCRRVEVCYNLGGFFKNSLCLGNR